MKPTEISALIALRAYANNTLDNGRVRLTKDQVNALEHRIVDIDRRVVAEIINLKFDDNNNAEPVTFDLPPKKKTQ